MRKIYRSNLFFFFILVWSILGSIILAKIFREIGIYDGRIRLLVNHIVCFFIPAIGYVKLTNQSFKEVFKLNKLSLRDLILVIILGFVCVPLMNAFGAISSLFFENTISNFMTEISSTPYFILMLLIAVMPAITEEITLRGIILSGYEDKSKFKAAIMGGIMFGVFHLNAHQFIYTAMLGFVLVYAVRVTGSIYTSMIIHFILNGTSVTIQKLIYNSKQITEEAVASVQVVEGKEEMLGTIFGIGIWIIIAGSIAFFILSKLEKNYKKRNFIELENNKRYLNKEIVEVDERMVNVPFVMSIVVFIVFMILFR